MDVNFTGIALIGAIILGIAALLVLILTLIQTNSTYRYSAKRPRQENASICVVIGSGKGSYTPQELDVIVFLFFLGLALLRGLERTEK